jgi:hypothetical protein
MNRLNDVKEKLKREWIENKQNRTQCLQEYIGREFNDVKRALQDYCRNYTDVEIFETQSEFINAIVHSSNHVLENSDTWVICLLSNNIIIDIDFAQG